MYFGVGLFVGAGVGVALVYGKRGDQLVVEEFVLTFVIGAAVLGGGIASLCGDRLMPYKVIPPLPPAHSGVSELCSISAIVTGAVLMLLALARSSGWL